MALFRGADVVVVRAVHPLDHGAEQHDVAIHQLPRGYALARRGLLDLLAVLVCAGEEQHVIAVEPLEAGDRIGRDDLVGVADVRGAVRVGNRGSDVIAGFFGHVPP